MEGHERSLERMRQIKQEVIQILGEQSIVHCDPETGEPLVEVIPIFPHEEGPEAA